MRNYLIFLLLLLYILSVCSSISYYIMMLSTISSSVPSTPTVGPLTKQPGVPDIGTSKLPKASTKPVRVENGKRTSDLFVIPSDWDKITNGSCLKDEILRAYDQTGNAITFNDTYQLAIRCNGTNSDCVIVDASKKLIYALIYKDGATLNSTLTGFVSPFNLRDAVAANQVWANPISGTTQIDVKAGNFKNISFQ